VKKSGRASRDAHLNDDEAVVKMGHPGVVAFRARTGNDNDRSRSFAALRMTISLNARYLRVYLVRFTAHGGLGILKLK